MITVVQVRFQIVATESRVIDFLYLKDNMGLSQTEWREQTQVDLELKSDFFPADPDTSKSPRLSRYPWLQTRRRCLLEMESPRQNRGIHEVSHLLLSCPTPTDKRTFEIIQFPR